MLLGAMKDRQCRYPVSGDGAQTRFCAEEVSAERWAGGRSGDRYCDAHRGVCLTGIKILKVRDLVPSRTWSGPARLAAGGL